MGWIREHPYASALAITGLLVIVGIVIVNKNAPVSVPESAITWSAGIPTSPYPQNNSQTKPQAIVQQVIQNPSPTNITLPISTSQTPTATPAPQSGSFDYLSLIEGSSNASTNASTSANSDSASTLAQAYAFIPQGFVATTSTYKKAMTPEQQALYEYGNEVGGTIQSFETQHPGQAQILMNQIEDRSDQTKIAAVVSLGKALATVGTSMSAMDDVPDSVSSYHNALAQSYQDIGAKLQLVPQAQSDADFVTAIENYDKAADGFTKNFVALAVYFSAQGVTFSSQDPGNEFSFSAAPGL